MNTIYDFVSVAIFIALVGMFLQFSRKEDQDIAAYIWPMLGCAIGNFLGNELDGIAGPISAWAVFIATGAYIFLRILKNEGVADHVDEE
jgi:hypothetical protein